MPTIANGNEVEIHVPITGDVTITPSGGHVEFGCNPPSGTDAPASRKVYVAETITIPAGSQMFLRAVGGSATYTDVLGVDGRLPALVSGGGNSGRYRLKARPYAVMASPPTVTVSTTNPLSAGQSLQATNISGAVNTAYGGAGPFSILRCDYLAQKGITNPDYNYLRADNVQQTTAPTYGTVTPRLSFIHHGARVVIPHKGTGLTFLIQVNGEYVSMTPGTIAADGSNSFIDIDFGSAASRRIDVDFSSTFALGGLWVGLSDRVTAAPARGGRIAAQCDSFGVGTGNERSTIYNWVNAAAEFLTLDDVVIDAVGSTGLLSTNSNQSGTYRQRAVYSVYPLLPDEHWISLSINDVNFATDLVIAELQSLVADSRANIPNARIVVFSPTSNKGVGSLVSNTDPINSAAKAWCDAQNIVYVDDLRIPLSESVVPHTMTLTTAVAAAATSAVFDVAPVVGATYQFADGTRFFVRSRSAATTGTVDKIGRAQIVGAVATQVGGSYMTGTGSVASGTGGLTGGPGPAGWGTCDEDVAGDGTHPRERGHIAKGLADAGILAAL